MVEKDSVRRSYDELADEHAEQRIETDRGTEILTGFLDSLAGPAYALDAGCGQGSPVLARLESATTAIGVDFSREQLKLAVENAPDASLVQGDMTSLPFEPGTFDAVVALWSLIHVPMDDHQTVVDEFARVLRPGGRVLLSEGTNEWTGENPDWLGGGVRMEWNIAGAKATRDQLHGAGFEILDTWGVPPSLEADRKRDEGDRDPWTFFSARLDG